MPRSRINIKTIQKEFGLTFLELMVIVRDEGWKTDSKNGTFFNRNVVYDYFAKRGMTPQTMNFKQIMAEYGLTKDEVFTLIKTNKWKPVTTGTGTGALWAFDRATIAEYFAKRVPGEHQSNPADNQSNPAE